MAEATVVKEFSLNLKLDEKEAKALFKLLNYGVAYSTLTTMGLMPLFDALVSTNEVGSDEYVGRSPFTAQAVLK